MPGLLPVEDAIRRIVAGVEPMPAESVPVTEAAGRVLASPLAALRTQPPFDASAMDGYAVRAVDVADAGARLTIVGESQAGLRFAGTVGPGQAARISTGAPLPAGADAILIRENAVADGAALTATEPVVAGRYIRRAGYDFRKGDLALEAGRRLGMRETALAASLGHAAVSVRQRPRVVIIATGDELVPPGTAPGPDQIVATNALAVAVHARACGAEAIDLGIVRDDLAATEAAIDRAIDLSADVIVTSGGASVGEHDLVRPALAARGIDLDFWRIAMRPGKPLMFGVRPSGSGRRARVLGLPGNPVSSTVCSIVFLTPLLDALMGRPLRDPAEPAVLGIDLPANDDRQDYLRSTLVVRDGALPLATPLPQQNSGMFFALAAAGCLVIRPPLAPAAKAGDPCRIIRLP